MAIGIGIGIDIGIGIAIDSISVRRIPLLDTISAPSQSTQDRRHAVQLDLTLSALGVIKGFADHRNILNSGIFDTDTDTDTDTDADTDADTDTDTDTD